MTRAFSADVDQIIVVTALSSPACPASRAVALVAAAQKAGLRVLITAFIALLREIVEMQGNAQRPGRGERT